MFTSTTPAAHVAALPPDPLAAPLVQVLPVTAPAAPEPPGATQAAPALAAPPARTRLVVRHATRNVLVGHAVTVVGTLRAARAGQDAPHAAAGALVVLQTRARRGWRTVARDRTGARGRYRLRYRPVRLGGERLRVRFAATPGARGAQLPVGRLEVYRLVEVSWYSARPPGGSLACGGWLTGATLGVASRTLPCGTSVTLRYGGHTVTVPVVDRGPYVAGREYDLTEATKQALGFEGVGAMWATR